MSEAPPGLSGPVFEMGWGIVVGGARPQERGTGGGGGNPPNCFITLKR